MTFQNPLNSQQRAFNTAVATNCFIGVLRACGVKAACRPHKRRYYDLIKFNDEQNNTSNGYPALNLEKSRFNAASTSWEASLAATGLAMTLMSQFCSRLCLFFLKNSRIKRFNRFRVTAFPTRFDTVTPSREWPLCPFWKTTTKLES